MSKENIPASPDVGPIRPPSEAGSLLIRATRNCPWNKCEFCPVYKRSPFEMRPVEDIIRDIDLYADRGSLCQTAFIQDANSLMINTPDLVKIISHIKQKFPHIHRVTSYARARTVARKPLDELKKLHKAGLSRLHIGLESGYDALLQWMKKGHTSKLSEEAGQKIKEAGISLCFYVILGLGGRLNLEGKQTWRKHTLETARVLNRVDPDHIRVRTLAVRKGTPLYEKLQKGEFEKSSDVEVVREEELFIKNLNVTSHFVSDHMSNILMDVKGKLPEDKKHMLSVIRAYLELPLEEQLRFRLETLFRYTGYFPNFQVFNQSFDSPQGKDIAATIKDMEANQPGSVQNLIDQMTSGML